MILGNISTQYLVKKIVFSKPPAYVCTFFSLLFVDGFCSFFLLLCLFVFLWGFCFLWFVGFCVFCLFVLWEGGVFACLGGFVEVLLLLQLL